MMNFLLLSLAVSIVSVVNGLSLKGPKVPQVDKEASLQELEEAELLKVCIHGTKFPVIDFLCFRSWKPW